MSRQFNIDDRVRCIEGDDQQVLSLGMDYTVASVKTDCDKEYIRLMHPPCGWLLADRFEMAPLDEQYADIHGTAAPWDGSGKRLLVKDHEAPTGKPPILFHLDLPSRAQIGMRRLLDGRALIFGVIKKCPLPDGVDDAKLSIDVITLLGLNMTDHWKGKTWIDLIEEGLPSATLSPVEQSPCSPQ